MYRLCPKCFESYPADVEHCPADRARLVTPVDRDLAGATLDDRYAVDAVLGEGGMSVVYQAHDDLLKRLVAIKVMRWHSIQPGEGVRRFLDEVRAATSLRSPNTVATYDAAISSEGFLYYTMELLHGETLAERLCRQATIPLEVASNIVLQVCDSLAEAHGRGILHRDLKPENLFLSRGEKAETVKVLDFGIAKQFGHDSEGRRLTQAGMIVGTPQYMSPEQILNKPMDVRSDLYSLGVILFECVTGRLPFVDASDQMLVIRKVQEEAPIASMVAPDKGVSRGLDRFLKRILAREPDLRPPTVDRFRADLAAVLAGEWNRLPLRTWTEGEFAEGMSGRRRSQLASRRGMHAVLVAMLVGASGGATLTVWRPWSEAPVAEREDGGPEELTTDGVDESIGEVAAATVGDAVVTVGSTGMRPRLPETSFVPSDRRPADRVKSAKPKGKWDDLIRKARKAED